MSSTARSVVESAPFHRAVIALIVINAIIMGVETYPAVAIPP